MTAEFFDGERVLENDNPVFGGYWYLADGKPFQNLDVMQGTIADLRALQPTVREWRYANLIQRNLPAL